MEKIKKHIFGTCFLVPAAAGLYWVITACFFHVHASLVELAAGVLSFSAALMLRKEKPAGLLLSSASCMLFFLYFMDIRLYGQMWLQVFYVALNMVSLFAWREKRGGVRIKPSLLPRALQVGMPAIFVSFVAGCVAAGMDAVGVMDFASVLLLAVAPVLLIRKKLEYWLVSGANNLLSIALFWMTGSYVVLVLNAAAFVNAVAAIRRWRKEL
ncbi:MAG: nicotinamide riboside transporter PnuC [Rickettsiales bacterium]|nr:nicotinamide riboside transporter PnuC [Rickettsiales bacterium]